MAEDWTLSSKVYTPTLKDPLEMATGLERWRILQNQNKITGLEAQQKEVDVRSLADWKKTRDPSSLIGASPELRTTAATGDRSVAEHSKDVMSRDAHYLLAEKDPKIKKDLWNAKGAEYVKKGWITPDAWEKHRDNPSDEVLTNFTRGNMGVRDSRATTGEETDADAAARSRYEIHNLDPNKPQQRSNVRPGGALAGGTPVGGLGGRTRPLPESVTPPPVTTTPSAGGAPVTPGPMTTGPTSEGNSATLTPSNRKVNEYSANVPKVPIGTELPSGPGVINQGSDPQLVQAKEAGLKKYNEEIAPMATAASKTEAALGTMRSLLESGRVTTDKLAEVKTSIAGFLYGATKDANAVQKITGVSPEAQEVFLKESTRMGLAYARDTNGTRQAAQNIQIELAANPSMLNTENGNLKVIKIMDAGNKYDKEMSKAAEAYLAKNGHLTGFENWWTTAHPVNTFISKAVPYQVPPSVNEMQKGVTYEFAMKGQDGKPQMKDGKPVIFKGMWNGSGFER